MLTIFQGNRPDITPAQIAAVLTALFAVIAPFCVLFGVELSVAQTAALNEIQDVAKVLAPVLIVGDAGIRIGRNIHDGKVTVAGIIAAGGTTEQGPVTTAPALVSGDRSTEPSTAPAFLPGEPSSGADPGSPPLRPEDA